MPSEFVTTPGKISGFSKGKFIKKGKTYRVTVTWKAPLEDGGAEITGYFARVGIYGRWSSWTYLDEPTTLMTNLRPGRCSRPCGVAHESPPRRDVVSRAHCHADAVSLAEASGKSAR